MKSIFYYGYFIFIFVIGCIKKPANSVKLVVNQVAIAPEPVTNNAVSEAFINNTPYIFSFGGLDSTKVYSGIHQRSYRYDVKNNSWLQLANLPDTLGKIANAATLIKDTIYIMGGYHVFENGTEVSSNKVHRYAVKSNQFLSDGTPIPIPIDDHVQTVWRDSLIYVISGWSHKENVPDVQIYNPYSNTWKIGTSIPNSHQFKAFGASGVIIKDTIYYFGGAAMGKNFPIQSQIRKGIINPENSQNITWTTHSLDSTYRSYRMVAANVYNSPHFIGGSATTYNYNGISYTNSGGVLPHFTSFYYKNGKLQKHLDNLLPMDLRGIASISDSIKLLYGGMESNQKVSNKILKLSWNKGN